MKFIYFAKRLVNIEHLLSVEKLIGDIVEYYYIEARFNKRLTLRERFNNKETMDNRFKIIAKQLGV